jgi:hypothetical protein
MLRQKKRLNNEERAAVRVLDDLEDLVEDGVLSENEYEQYCDMLEFALRDKNGKETPVMATSAIFFSLVYAYVGY